MEIPWNGQAAGEMRLTWRYKAQVDTADRKFGRTGAGCGPHDFLIIADVRF